MHVPCIRLTVGSLTKSRIAHTVLRQRAVGLKAVLT